MRISALLLFALAAVQSPSACHAEMAFFGFTSVTPNNSESGSLLELDLLSNDLKINISRTSGVAFDIYQFPRNSKALSPFYSSSTDDWFQINFSQDVDRVSFIVGDRGGDYDVISMNGWSEKNGGGSLVDNETIDWGYSNHSFDSSAIAAVQGDGIRSITFRGGSTSFPNSMYFSVMIVTFTPTAIPEPSTLLSVFGILGIGATRRRRS